MMMMLWLLLLTFGLLLIQLTMGMESPPISIPLNFQENRYSLLLNVGNSTRKVLFSTGSTDLIVENCVGSSMDCLIPMLDFEQQKDDVQQVDLDLQSNSIQLTAVAHLRSNISFVEPIHPSISNRILIYKNLPNDKNPFLTSVQGFLGASFLQHESDTTFSKLLFIRSKYDHDDQEGDHKLIYTMDFNDPNEKSWLHLSQTLPSPYKWEEIQWSERWVNLLSAKDAKDGFNVSFNAFNLSICGMSTFSNVSSFWKVIINTEMECLSLPEEFYETLSSWTSIQYDTSRNLSFVHPKDIQRLPILYFQLSFYSKESFGIPLDHLLLDKNTTTPDRQYLCIKKTKSIIQHAAYLASITEGGSTLNYNDIPMIEIYNMHQYPVVFGAMVLKSLMTIVDMDQYRIGFIQKRNQHVQDSLQNSNTLCSVPVQCIGEQQRNNAINECIDPDCSLWLFKTLDPSNKTCIVSSVWFFIFIALLSTFTSTEILFYFRKRKLVESGINNETNDLTDLASFQNNNSTTMQETTLPHIRFRATTVMTTTPR